MGELEDGQIEVRQLYEAEDFPAGEATERLKDIGVL